MGGQSTSALVYRDHSVRGNLMGFLFWVIPCGAASFSGLELEVDCPANGNLTDNCLRDPATALSSEFESRTGSQHRWVPHPTGMALSSKVINLQPLPLCV